MKQRLIWLCKYNTKEQCDDSMDCVNCILNKVRQEIKSHTTYGGHDSDYWFNHGLDVSLEVVDRYLFEKHIQEEESE